MKYENIVRGKFKERPNRFIASVCVEGNEERAHVKNTGRCRELLEKDADIYLEDHIGEMGKRKLRYSLIAVEKKTERGTFLVNMDSQAPNKVVKEAVENGDIRLPGMSSLVKIKAEAMYGESRLDFYAEDDRGREAYIEVKGVTLEEGGLARFPDAPTERGVRHLEELIKAAGEGKKAFVIFVIQMKGVNAFTPNDRTHKAFADALRKASSEGVNVMAYDCIVTRSSIVCADSVPVIL